MWCFVECILRSCLIPCSGYRRTIGWGREYFQGTQEGFVLATQQMASTQEVHSISTWEGVWFSMGDI